MSMQGRVWKYGDNVNTDVLFPGKYTYTVRDRKEMAKHALEDLDPTFAGAVRAGDIIVGGKNFGCGSSREQAAICLKEAGVAAVVAASFARIFYRNAINEGLPLIRCPEAIDAIGHGDIIHIDFGMGILQTGGQTFTFPPLPEQVQEILHSGGLVNYVKKKIRNG